MLAEAIEHIGETKCWVSDLEQAWARESDSARTVVQRADAIGVLETDFSAPRAAVWDLVTRPENRLRWQGIDSVVENTPTVAAAPARKTTACTARTRSSRTFSPGAHSIT